MNDNNPRNIAMLAGNEPQGTQLADARLHLLISAQVERTPDAPALTFGARTLTYREVDQRANQLAHYLRNIGVGPESLVGISAFRSFEMVLGLLGILKAGGAYVPIDPEYPANRLAFMLADAAVPVLLAQRQVSASLPPHKAHVVCLDDEWHLVNGESTAAPVVATAPEGLAYMIYTSGSTGRPKGALNTHRGICNRLLWMQDRYRLTSMDSVLQKTPFSFDVSVWEFFWPLMTGARLVIARPGGHQDPAYLSRLIRQENITIIHFVPSMLRTFLEEPSASQCTSLRHVICSGEALTYDLQEKFFERLPCELQNLYGPTEAAVDVTHWTCRRDGGPPVVPIGRPVSNTQIHILDDHLTPVPVGAEGELHIGGAQVGRGYHNRPHLTAEKFVPDPFSSEPGAKLYKTGDLARWMPDGNIEYLGRLDFQVKIRGFRIELGEIESVLAQHSNVRQAVVNVFEDSKDGKQLVAYLLPRGCRHASVSELHRFLLTKLPDYMVPSLFMWLDAIPLSPNGKVDRRALPVPTHTRPQLSQSYAEPSTDLERCIVALWRETLRIDQVGIDDRFFELGGNSLGLARIHVRLQETLGREFPISTLFEFITVRSLAAHFESPREAPSATKSSQDRARLQRKAFFARRPSHRQL